MVVLIDTNVIIDYLVTREPFCKTASEVPAVLPEDFLKILDGRV